MKRFAGAGRGLIAGVGLVLSTADAQQPMERVSIEARAEGFGQAGNSTYRIGGRVEQDGLSARIPFPISRLEWPLEAAGLGLSLSARSSARWEGFGAIEWMEARGGGMKDADWELEEAPFLITTYSESDVRGNGWGVEAGARRWVGRRPGPHGDWEAALGVGVRYRQLEWRARDAFQWHPPFPQAGRDFFAGPVVDYRLAVWMPYAEISAAWNRRPWSARFRSGLAPWVHAEDRDDHRLRGIEARARTTGAGGFAEIGAEHALGSDWRAGLSLRAAWIRTEGWARNVVYGDGDPDLTPGERWRIRQDITMRETRASLYLGRSW